MLNNFRAAVKVLTKLYQINPFKAVNVIGFGRPNLYSFCANKAFQIKDSDTTFELLVGRLKDKVDYC